MANWATVGYRIEGKQKDLQEIYELFGEFDKGERKPFDELSAKNWEGNIAWLWEKTPRITISEVSSKVVK